MKKLITKKCKAFRKFLKKTLSNKKVIRVLISLAIIISLFLLRSLFFAAFVNGKPIFRITILKGSEKQSGSVVLENLIEKKLIFEQAKKENVYIEKEMIDAEIKNIEAILEEQELSLEEALALGNQTLKELREQIKIQKIVEAVLGKDIKITDEEVEEYFIANKEFFGSTAQLEDFSNQIQSEIFKQQLSTLYTDWIQSLKEEANIINLVKY